MGATIDTLQDMRAFLLLSSAQRRAVAETLALRLGPAFGPCDKELGALGLVALRHLASGMVMVAIPGGSFAMGLSSDDVEATRPFVRPEDPWAQGILERLSKEARPAHSVTISPFLCGTAPLSHGLAVRTLGEFRDRTTPLLGRAVPDTPVVLTPAEAHRARVAVGLRQLSEAEFEYVAREAGRVRWVSGWDRAWHQLFGTPTSARQPLEVNALGIGRLGYGEWVADRWHDSYEGAPGDGSAWAPKDQPEVFRASGGAYFPWQSESEVLTCLAAWRDRPGRQELDQRCVVRFAMDLPIDLVH